MTTPKILIRRSAEKDLLNHAHYLVEQSNFELGESFLKDSREAFTRLAASPELGVRLSVRNPALSNARKWRVSTRFRHFLVVYFPLEDGIDVIHVFHSAQNYRAVLERIVRLSK